MRVHVVCATQYRDDMFNRVILDDVRGMFPSGVDREAELAEFDGEDDPAHLLSEYPPTVSVSNLLTV